MHVWLEVAFYSAIGSACMMVKDLAGTVLIDAIANGRARLAGNLDGLLDIVSIMLNAYSGVHLLHYGWRGMIGLLPIALVGKLTTEHSVKWSAKNITEPDSV